MYSYKKLEQMLKAKGHTKSELCKVLGVSSRTLAKIAKGEKIADRVLIRIADFLGCGVNDLFESISQNKLLSVLREEKNAKISGGIYHELQVRMTYNSNHIEGSKLSEDQTRLIFETNTVDAGDGVPVDDIIETVNHFCAVDYCLDIANEELSEEIIKELHRILKQGTKDGTLLWFSVGDYKKRANVVGGSETAKPKDVPKKMQELLSAYNKKENKTFFDIVKFHSDFEHIHPFQDGNGRVGRLIALKECLKINEVPFIIEDTKKMFYYRGLSKWNEDSGYLTDTCLDGQDTVKRLLKALDIEL